MEGMQREDTREVFICHSSSDSQIALEICRHLEDYGISCWIAPRDPLPGVPFAAQLINAIESAGIVLLVLSSNSKGARAVLNEVELASNRGKVILPVRIEDVSPSSSLEFYIRSINWFDLTRRTLDEAATDLIKDLERVLRPPGARRLGALLKRLRISRNLSREQLATRASISIATIDAFERGLRVPQRDTTSILVTALDLSPAERDDVYRLAVEDSGQTNAALGTSNKSDPLTTNLPLLLSSFAGRDHELAQITTLVAETRLVTITGPGGVGKTRVAIEVGRSMLNTFADGVWLLDLAPISQPHLVGAALASTVGLDTPDSPDVVDAIAAWLRSRRLLLLFDDCEHLLKEVRRIAEKLLRECHDLKLIATSREPLNVSGERVYRLPSLSVPPPGVTATMLLQYGAGALFVDRASAADARFVLTDRDVPFIVEICRRLDGIPLAIELAAARLKVLSPEELARRLDDQFRVLTGGDSSALPRHQTLRATIDWSYDLLSEKERTLFREISVFDGGFALETVNEFSRNEAVDESELLDTLGSLVDRSLVQQSTEGTTRYWLVESTRRYAYEKAAELGEHSALERRRAEWIIRLAAQLTADLQERSQQANLLTVRVELENIRSAINWCISENGDVALAGRIVASLAGLWLSQDLLEEGKSYARAVLDRLGAEANKDVADSLHRILATTPTVRFRSINISGWRQFSNVTLALHERLTVLTGANGAGKTTLLNLLAQHFGWEVPLASLPEGDRNSYGPHPPQSFANLVSSDGERLIGWIEYDDGSAADIIVPELTRDVTFTVRYRNRRAVRGLYIPSHRPIFVPTRIDTPVLVPPLEAFKLYEAAIQSNWIRGEKSGETPLQIMKAVLIGWLAGGGKERDWAEHFTNALSRMLPPSLKFQGLYRSLDDLVVASLENNFPLDAVSGGIAALIDLTWQIFTATVGETGAFAVLIDEPENHLHPELQRSLLPNLMRAFPNIQFIVASHSPLVVTSARQANVYALVYADDTMAASDNPDELSPETPRLSQLRGFKSLPLEFDRAGTANDVLRDVLGLEYTMPEWASATLNEAVGRLAKSGYTVAALDAFETELLENKLGGFIPEAVARLSKGSES
jgi:predicted ATPase/transcriptional regulator with XRE-family HTH domain